MFEGTSWVHRISFDYCIQLILRLALVQSLDHGCGLHPLPTLETWSVLLRDASHHLCPSHGHAFHQFYRVGIRACILHPSVRSFLCENLVRVFPGASVCDVVEKSVHQRPRAALQFLSQLHGHAACTSYFLMLSEETLYRNYAVRTESRGLGEVA